MGAPSLQAASSVQSGGIEGNVLVLGGTGLIGSNVLRQLRVHPGRVHAATRAAGPPPGLANLATWHCGAERDLSRLEASWPPAEAILSAGPLDAFATWLDCVRPPDLRRVVALGSTSAVVKQASSDPAERALAERLLRAEERLAACCDRAGVAWTVLRPTLIWGEGRDRNVSRLAAWIRRLGFLPLPVFATGMRQPIRARDVAAAMLAALVRPASAGHRLDLPGGETLAYDQMARRIAAAVRPPGRILRIPGTATRWLAKGAERFGVVGTGATAALSRLREDLVFPGTTAVEALGIRPAGFVPTPDDFPNA